MGPTMEIGHHVNAQERSSKGRWLCAGVIDVRVEVVAGVKLNGSDIAETTILSSISMS